MSTREWRCGRLFPWRSWKCPAWGSRFPIAWLYGIYQWSISILVMKRSTKPSRRKKTPPATVSQDDMRLYVEKLFMNGRSQALRLPKVLRFEGDSVYLKRVPGGVMIITEEGRREALLRAYGSIPDFPDIEKLRNQERPELDRLFE